MTTATSLRLIQCSLLAHPVFLDPVGGDAQTGLGPDTNDPGSFGVVNTPGNNPRQMQFGLRFTF